METCRAGQNLRCGSTARIFVIVSCVLEEYLQNMNVRNRLKQRFSEANRTGRSGPFPNTLAF